MREVIGGEATVCLANMKLSETTKLTLPFVFVILLSSCDQGTSSKGDTRGVSKTTEASPSTRDHVVEDDATDFDELIEYGEPIEVKTVSASGTPTVVVLTD
jgi:uncharacterized lipoprotein